MKRLGRRRRRIPWKALGLATLRYVGQELRDRVMTNLTPDERHELGDLVLDTRDAIRDLATDAESRRMAQLMAKALSGEAR
jgi:hypothetical protein